MGYIRVRNILGAPGQGHKYVSRNYVINTSTGELTSHPEKPISIKDTSVRIKEKNCPRWEIQDDSFGFGWMLLRDDKIETLNNKVLTDLVKGETNGDQN